MLSGVRTSCIVVVTKYDPMITSTIFGYDHSIICPKLFRALQRMPLNIVFVITSIRNKKDLAEMGMIEIQVFLISGKIIVNFSIG